MSAIFGLLTSLLLPGLVGYVWLHLLWRSAHIAARVGYGYLLGIVFLAVVLLGWNAIGLTLAFVPITLVLLFLALIPVFLHSLQPQAKYDDCNSNTKPWQTWVWWLLSVVLVVRFSGLLHEDLLRPLYPWDAWVNWAPKAKVWFGVEELVPFVHYSQWPVSSLDIGAYSLGNPDASLYPPLVPLVQLWVALGVGEWRDNWINLPWVLCAVALALAFYGQLRLLMIPPLVSMLAAYMLLSVPYLNTHVALGGYADLWMAAFYCAAVMSLIGWSSTRSKTQLLLVILMGIGCILTKKPGLVWAITLIPGLLISIFPVRLSYLILLFLAIASGVLVTIHGVTFTLVDSQPFIFSADMIQIPGLGTFPIAYHSSFHYFVDNVFIRDNWHLLGWLIAFILPTSIFFLNEKSSLFPTLITLLVGILFIFFVFSFTQHYQAAADSTTINRATFHLLPALFYFSIAAVLFVQTQTSSATHRASTANLS
jgi:hypothetical protein